MKELLAILLPVRQRSAYWPSNQIAVWTITTCCPTL